MLHFFSTVLEQSFLFAPFVFGGYISIALMKLPDLSLEAAFLAGAIATSKVISFFGSINSAASIASVIIVPIVAGMLVGFFTFFLTQITKLPHLIASMITIGLMHGMSQIILQTSLLSLASHKTILTIFNSSEILPLSIIFLIMTALLALFFKTALGICLAVYGSNPQFFTHYHISTKLVVAAGLMLGNGLAGLAGSLITQAHGFVEITMSTGIALQAITALMLGNLMYKMVCHKKKTTVFISVTGIVLYFIIQQSLLRLGFDLKYFTSVQALAVLILMISQYRTENLKKNNQLGV